MPSRNKETAYPPWQLALVSLLLSMFVWLMAKQQEIDTEIVSVAVVMTNRPPYLKADWEPTSLDVSLRYPRAIRAEMLPSNFKIEIDAASMGLENFARQNPGATYNYPIKQGDFKVAESSLPAGAISIIHFDPEVVLVTPSFITEQAVIDPFVTGQPANGFLYRREKTKVNPQVITIMAAPNTLQYAQRNDQNQIELQTEPFSLKDRRQLAVNDVRVNFPEGIFPFEQEDRAVELTVVIEEEREEREFSDVPIKITTVITATPSISPPNASVTVRGPRSLVRLLTREDFVFLVGSPIVEEFGAKNSDVKIEARVQPQSDIIPRARRTEIEVLEITPPTIEINFPAAPEPEQ